LADLINEGYLRFLPSNIEEAVRMINHDMVSELLITGGAPSYDKILWGLTEEAQKKNKQTGNKLVKKKFEAELGGVCPYIVVPGEWTDSELQHHAEQAVATRLINGGHVCCGSQILVLDKDWPQREKFIEKVTDAYNKCAFQTYYPGTAAKCDNLKVMYNVPIIGNKAAFIPDISSSGNSHILRDEAFGPVMAEATLSAGNNAEQFLRMAVDFCNESLYGSLSSTLVIDPKTESKHKKVLQESIANLKYGSIGVNVWGGFTCFNPLPWGAFPGHLDTDIQSGKGKIDNVSLIDNVEKAVIYSPFTAAYHFKPPTSNDTKVQKRMAYYFMNPSLKNLLPVMGAALLGI